MRSPPDDAAAYALGALDADEVVEFTRLLAASALLREEVDSFAAVTTALALLVLPVVPRTSLKGELMGSL